jgi:EpsI family protein
LRGLWADDYVSATYRNAHFPNQIYVFIPFYKYQSTRHTVHAPQSCLLGTGWTLIDSKERPVKVNNGKQIKIMTMVLEKGNMKLLSSYFFFQRGRAITSPWDNKFYLMWDSIMRRRSDGALVRAEMTMAPGQKIEDSYKRLEDFISHLWAILPEYVPI